MQLTNSDPRHLRFPNWTAPAALVLLVLGSTVTCLGNGWVQDDLPIIKLHLSRRATGWVARVLEALGRNPFPGYRHLELLDVGTITAPDAVKRTFGFQPMPLIEGVAYQMTPPNEVGRIRPPSSAERGSRSRGLR